MNKIKFIILIFKYFILFKFIIHILIYNDNFIIFVMNYFSYLNNDFLIFKKNFFIKLFSLFNKNL